MSASSGRSEYSRPIPLLWARFNPPAIVPNSIGELIARPLRNIPEGAQLRLEIETGGDRRAIGYVAGKPKLAIRALDFSRSLKTAYVYVANLGEESIQLAPAALSVPLDASAVKWVNHPVPPNDVGCAVLPLRRSVSIGQTVYVEVRLANSESPQDSTRAVVRATNGGGTSAPATKSSWVVDCPAHLFGSPKKGAEVGLAKALQLWKEDPRAFAKASLCRHHAPGSYFDFGTLCDVSRINIGLILPLEEASGPIENVTAEYARRGQLAYLATRPFRMHGLVNLAGDDLISPATTRLRIWVSLASGAKSVGYRSAPDNPLIQQAVDDVTAELKLLGDLLAIAQPVDWASTKSKGLVVRSLLCGDKAILLVVAHCGKPSEWGWLAPGLAKHAQIRVRRLPGFRAARIVALTAGSDARLHVGGEHYHIETTLVESAQGYVLLPSG